MSGGRIITLVVAGIVAALVSLYFENRVLKTKRQRKIFLLIKHSILRLLIATAVGIAATFIAQPWKPLPDGWPLWRALLFIGLCSFGMWGVLTLRYWAYKKVQEKKQGESEKNSGS